MAYQVSAESKDELSGAKPRKSFRDMCHNASRAAEHIMRLAGATSYVCHTTPSGSNKGGRDDQAVQQEYQANRKDRSEKPEFLDDVRAFIGQELNGKPHLDQEADDGMAQAAYGADNPSLCIVCSKDKDLRMVPGLHLDMYTGEIVNVPADDFGTIELERKYDEQGKVKSTKLVGYGAKFFFAQVLMGDTADHIKGAPAVPARLLAEHKPSAAYIKAINSGSEAALMKVMEKPSRGCGAVTTFDILDHTRSSKEAFNLVKRVFVELEQDHAYEFKHWNTGAVVRPTQALLGDMYLLWMRRNKNPKDVVEWLKSL
jgi:hypothetical protein